MKKISYLIFTIVSFLHISCTDQKQAPLAHFSFHLLSEPQDLDPAHVRGASGNYLFYNLFRGLYRYSNNQLKEESVKKCTWKTPLVLHCLLKKKKWSNGDKILAKHYLQTYRRLFSPQSKSLQTETLLNIKNASAILAGKLPPEKLGIKITSDHEIIFTLTQPDSNFLYKLANPALAPLHPKNSYRIKYSENLITNGPYQIKHWRPGRFTDLTPNTNYDSRHKQRPSVKIYFVENDETALNLFETGKLSLLRRLTSTNVPRFEKQPGFFSVPFIRFDYIGLTHKLNRFPKLKKALALSLNYPELKKIYKAKGVPGCPGLPRNFMLHSSCHTFQPKEARKLFKQLPVNIQKMPLTLYFSKLGGKDIKKGMEWMQNQWQKHLNFKVDLESVEQGTYIGKLSQKNVSLFRKGVGVDHPTCLSALKTFAPESSENYINFRNKDYNNYLRELSQPNLNINTKKEICSKSLKILMDSYQWIPLGEIHFFMLHDQKYQGWQINHLNQLDLTHLKKKI